MSEIINNRKYRQQKLKELIKKLHEGKTVEEVREEFAEVIEGISPEEISSMEQSLIEEEGIEVEEIQKLCDVHAAVFRGSIEDIHAQKPPEEMKGHPVEVMKRENREVEKLIESRIKPHLEQLESGDAADSIPLLKRDFADLWEIDRHYARKENLIFPYMEKYDITAPPKVMWGVDEEIRELIKSTRSALEADTPDPEEIAELAGEAVHRVQEMIFKEENIMFPMVLDLLTEDEWIDIERSGDEYGYCLIELKERWKPLKEVEGKEWADIFTDEDNVRFSSGLLNPEELEAIFNTLPVDITFVNRDGLVKYFSEPPERAFPRPRTVIGRTVANCHPPSSVHVVEKIAHDLQTGRKDREDFWIRMGEKYIYIQFFAVRNSQGEFLGIMEVTRDIAPLQKVEGEKRLLDE